MIWVDKIEDIDFSSAWKANIFTHPGIANGVLREEISGLKKTYCVEDNILVFVNIFSDVKFTFDCLSMIFPTPTPEPGRIYTAISRIVRRPLCSGKSFESDLQFGHNLA